MKVTTIVIIIRWQSAYNAPIHYGIGTMERHTAKNFGRVNTTQNLRFTVYQE